MDDGSTDRTAAICQDLVARDSDVVLVELRRRFGKATALQTGFELARGEIIITMDGDLQDVPAEIPKFLARLDEGYDLVSGWKQNRKDSLVKRIESKIFNFITSPVTGLKLKGLQRWLQGVPTRGDTPRSSVRGAVPLHSGARACGGLPGR